jgi:hypothetical protein
VENEQANNLGFGLSLARAALGDSAKQPYCKKQ